MAYTKQFVILFAVYPSFDMSDDEKVMSKKGKVQEKDDAWHPKGETCVSSFRLHVP